jgi:hypothetical protein
MPTVSSSAETPLEDGNATVLRGLGPASCITGGNEFTLDGSSTRPASLRCPRRAGVGIEGFGCPIDFEAATLIAQ